jgi:hypothetical protein
MFDKFDFRLTVIYLHPLPLHPKRMLHPKAHLGDVMLPPHCAWVAMSLDDQLHMLQPKYVEL